MGQYQLRNNRMTIAVKSAGAELSSVQMDGKEYLWNADPAFWTRSSPVLFPFVGGLKNKQFIYAGNFYPMGQHGFARDMDFELVEQTTQSLKFALQSNEETLQKYPFDFLLTIEYILQDNHLEVLWNVKNTGKKELLFSIGGHPGFMCPINGEGTQTDYQIRFFKSGKPLSKFESMAIGEDGLINGKVNHFELADGLLPVTEHLFDGDALVLENYQADEIALVNPQGKAYLTVRFTTPLVGVWSPVKKNAPFICIEPWCGRCDRTDFSGELSQREYGNKLNPGDAFENGFEIVAE